MPTPSADTQARTDERALDLPSRQAGAGDGAAGGHPPATPLTLPPGPMTRRRVLGLALPIIGENLLQTAVGTIDTLMVSRLGKAAVAGVGTSLEIVFFIIAALSAVSVGATVLVAQSFGAGELPRANRLARQAIVWGVLLAIPVSTLGFLTARRVIGVFGTEPDVAAAATTYLRITAATSVALLLTFVCGAVLRGVGDSRTPLLASTVANVVNVVVAYGLIFGRVGLPRLGVAGSAWGAAIARATSAAILLALLARGARRVSVRGRVGWRPEPATGLRLLRLGVPAAIEQMLMAGALTTMMAVVAILGTASLAAQQIGFTALSVAFMPAFGFAMATTTLVGQSIGAGKPRDARLANGIAQRWATGWLCAGAVLYFALARPVMEVFTDDRAVIDNGVRALRALSLSLPLWGVWDVSAGALRGSGDTRTPMVTTALGMWLAVALAYLFVARLDGGIGLVWLTFVIVSPIPCVANWIALRRRLAPDAMLRG